MTDYDTMLEIMRILVQLFKTRNVLRVPVARIFSLHARKIYDMILEVQIKQNVVQHHR